MPIRWAAGAISGTTITMAEKMSINMPTISSSTLRPRRKLHCAVKWARIQATSFSGTWAVTRKLVSAWAAKMMMKMAPTSAIDSRTTRHRALILRSR